MNQRIKELAALCYETGPIGKDGWPEHLKFNEQKFAELIVQECVNVLHDNELWNRQISHVLNEHFRVKE